MGNVLIFFMHDGFRKFIITCFFFQCSTWICCLKLPIFIHMERKLHAQRIINIFYYFLLWKPYQSPWEFLFYQNTWIQKSYITVHSNNENRIHILKSVIVYYRFTYKDIMRLNENEIYHVYITNVIICT